MLRFEIIGASGLSRALSKSRLVELQTKYGQPTTNKKEQADLVELQPNLN